MHEHVSYNYLRKTLRHQHHGDSDHHRCAPHLSRGMGATDSWSAGRAASFSVDAVVQGIGQQPRSIGLWSAQRVDHGGPTFFAGKPPLSSFVGINRAAS